MANKIKKDYVSLEQRYIDRRKNKRYKLLRKGSCLNFLFREIAIPTQVKHVLAFVVGMYFWLLLLWLEVIYTY